MQHDIETSNGVADRHEVAEGLRYAHFRADANTGKLLEVASFLYAAIDLLNQKGLLDLAELDERKKQAAANLVEKFSERGMGVVHQKPEYDKYKFEGQVEIDCENRIPFCHAACCKLRFALSKQDVEEGIVRWDFSAPYLIARGPDGYCQHLHREKKCCTVHAHRPVPCRAFDCRNDKRIWLDFENNIVNPQINEPDWPGCLEMKTDTIYEGKISMAEFVSTTAAKNKSAEPAWRHSQNSTRQSNEHGREGDLMFLQRAIGNRAVGQILQRKCAACAAGGTQCAHCKEEEKQRLQRQTEGPASSAAQRSVPPIVDSVLNNDSGQPLDLSTRAFMESRFGYDFSRVRVHTEGKAAESARAVNALAYTVGQHVVFGAGRYAPQTGTGLKLLAHELAHVIQQRDARAPLDQPSSSEARWEREADAAAEAVLAADTTPTLHRSPGTWLARFVESRTLTEPDGSEVQVERVITPGRCRLRSETRTETSADITARQAFIELDLCRGRVGAQTRGELNYGQALNDAANAAARLLQNLASGQAPAQATRQFQDDIRQITPEAVVRLNLQAPDFRLNLTGTGRGSLAGGVSATGTARGEVDIGPVTVGVEGTIRGGTQEQTSGQVLVTVGTRTGGAPLPDCFICSCSAPKIEFRCTRRPPPERPRVPTPPRRPVIVPLFFEYADTMPRRGWEQRYAEMLQLAVDRMREGYTIARIEGNASPEGPLQQQPGERFEGNVELAQRRAEEARNDLREALQRALGGLGMRGMENLRTALTADFPVVGRGELFGSISQRELPESELFRHLLTELQPAATGQPDRLVEAHVLGEELPPDVAAEVTAQVEEFRTGRRGRRRLREAERLEAIFQPLRRALIFLNPPPLRLEVTPEIARQVIGESIPCSDAHRRVFDSVRVPPQQMFEGECREPGARTGGGQVR